MNRGPIDELKKRDHMKKRAQVKTEVPSEDRSPNGRLKSQVKNGVPSEEWSPESQVKNEVPREE